jgi:fluoride exporter
VPLRSLRVLVTRLPVDPDVAGPIGEAVLSAPRSAALVAVGGGFGALVRAAMEVADPPSNGWPWATLVVNITGTALLALLLVWVTERPAWGTVARTNLARPLIGTGLLGGYTTFSTFALETVGLMRRHEAMLAIGYVLSSTVGALAAGLFGLVLGRAGWRIVDHRHRVAMLLRAGHGDVPDDA